MTLEAIGNTARIALSADWCELAALMSSRQAASSADLIRSRAALEENDHGVVQLEIDPGEDDEVEIEILQRGIEEWASEVREELSLRSSGLGDTYPFVLRGSGFAWRLMLEADEEKHSHLLYLCCLLVTARRYGL